ncbi:TniQ family protein [Castellaniella sp.]|uniref:TniQ family protein n=1 Tax=Castellaniella sp. TaxID=1955812 RepID=UPI003A91D656
MNTVFNVLPIYPDESLACYLLRLATSESVPGIAGLIGHLKIGTNNTALNKNVELLATFTMQPVSALRDAMVCATPAHRSLREKFARLVSNPFCPHCLRENGYFKRGWRHGLVTACAKHRCELVDTCPSCNQAIDHARSNAFFCNCGQELAAIKPRMAQPSAIWVSAHISGDSHEEPGWPTLGNKADADWSTFDQLIFMFGNHRCQDAERGNQPRKVGKFRSVEQSAAFLKDACACLADFPRAFHEDVKHRLETGDKTKAGLASRLGPWFRAFRAMTEGAYPELRAAFAQCVAENFDGHDSKNPWIYELAPAHHLSITEAAKTLGVKAERLRAMLSNMPGASDLKANTFNTVTQEQCAAFRQYLGMALNQLEVLKRTGLNESVLKQFTRVGLLPRRSRPDWDLNAHRPYDMADVQAVESFLLGLIDSDKTATQTIALNDINRRIGTNKAAIDEVFEHIAQGTLRPINEGAVSHLGQLRFDREALAHIIGNSQAVTLMTAEHLARITGWKSESIRHWVKAGLLAGEPTETRGRLVYWIGMRAVHDFMRRYKVVSELARQLETSPKALSEKLHKLGVPIIGTQAVSPGVTRGGLVELRQILVRGLYQPQMSLLADEPPVHQFEELALS